MRGKVSKGQDKLRGLVAALAVDFGTRARNMVASIESLLGSGHEFDAAEIDVAGKAWADASAALWSLLGTEPKHSTDRTLVRIGLSDLAGLLAREEQLTRRVADLQKQLDTLNDWAKICGGKGSRLKDQQDIQSLYIAGGSSERLTVCQPRIDRAVQLGARITYDWTRTPNYEVTRPSDLSIRADAERDIAAVLRADILWVLAPQQLSEGAASELGAAIGVRSKGLWDGRIVVSGEHARRNIFAHLADEIYETHEEAWESLKPRVIGAGERATT